MLGTFGLVDHRNRIIPIADLAFALVVDEIFLAADEYFSRAFAVRAEIPRRRKIRPLYVLAFSQAL